jgi:hypothetical protein
LAGTGGIELGLDVGGGEVDVAGDGVGVGVAEQRLHHRQVHARLGQRGAEGMPQRMRVPTRHTRALPVVAEDRPQPGRCQRLATGGALGDHKQPARGRLGSFGEQVGLEQPANVSVQRDPAFLGALAPHPQPAATDVDVGHL